MAIPAYSNQNPHPTAVIREIRYMARNAMAFHAPIASWCLQVGLIKGSPAMGGVKYEITEDGRLYMEKYSDYDPKPEKSISRKAVMTTIQKALLQIFHRAKSEGRMRLILNSHSICIKCNADCSGTGVRADHRAGLGDDQFRAIEFRFHLFAEFTRFIACLTMQNGEVGF